MLPLSETTARAIYEALLDMAWYGEAVVEEAKGTRKADTLTIALRADAMSAGEENTDQVCAALADASALCVRPHDEDTFWFKISIPDVFPAGDFLGEKAVVVDGEPRKVHADEPPPEWLADARKAMKEEIDALRFEDFTPNHDEIARLADVYAAVKTLAQRTDAVFEFTVPTPPHTMHGGAHLKVRGPFLLEKENLSALLAALKISRSLSVSSTEDGHIYLSFWVNNIYLAKE